MFPFGPQTAVFKIAGKIFAFSGLERLARQITLKCDPEHAECCAPSTPRSPRIPHEQAPLDHGHARRQPAGELLEELIEDSYDLVAPRQALRAELGGDGGGAAVRLGERDQALEQRAAADGAEQRVHRVLGVRHQAAHVAGLVRDAGDVGEAPFGFSA